MRTLYLLPLFLLALSTQASELRQAIVFGVQLGALGGQVEYLKSLNAAILWADEAKVEALKQRGYLVLESKPVHALRLESIPLVKVNEVWNLGISGAGIKVAILDTGIDLNHSDVNASVECYNALTNTVGNCDDDNGHGTHVAGILAGRWQGNASDCNPSIGKACGVAPNASLIAVKVLNAQGFGTEADVLRGIEWAVQRGARILSLSLGAETGLDAPCYSFALSHAIDAYAEQGILAVVAAGNSGPNAQSIAAPACAKSALAIGSVADGSEGSTADELSLFSSRGPTDYGYIKPDVVAPGEHINSTYLLELGSYAMGRGTSMAAPHASGIAALVAEAYAKQGVEPPGHLIRAILLTATLDLGALGRDNFYGSGRMNAFKAVELASSTHAINDTLRPGEAVAYSLNATQTFKITLVWPENQTQFDGLELILLAPNGSVYKENDLIEILPNGTVVRAADGNLDQFRISAGEWIAIVNASNLSLPKPYAIVSDATLKGPFYKLELHQPKKCTAGLPCLVNASLTDWNGNRVSGATINAKFEGTESVECVLAETAGYYVNSSCTLRRVGTHELRLSATYAQPPRNASLFAAIEVTNLNFSIHSPDLGNELALKLMRGDVLNLTISVYNVTGEPLNKTQLQFINATIGKPDGSILNFELLNVTPEANVYNGSYFIASDDPLGKYQVAILANSSAGIEGYASFEFEVGSFGIEFEVYRNSLPSRYFHPNESMLINGTVYHFNRTVLPSIMVNATLWPANLTLKPKASDQNLTDGGGRFNLTISAGNETGAVGDYELRICVNDSSNNTLLLTESVRVSASITNLSLSVGQEYTLGDSMEVLIHAFNQTYGDVYGGLARVDLGIEAQNYASLNCTLNASGKCLVSWPIPLQLGLRGVHNLTLSAEVEDPFGNSLLNETNVTLRAMNLSVTKPIYLYSANQTIEISGIVLNSTNGVENVTLNATLLGWVEDYCTGGELCPEANSTTNTTQLSNFDGNFSFQFYLPKRAAYKLFLISNTSEERGYVEALVYSGLLAKIKVLDEYNQSDLVVNPGERLTLNLTVYAGLYNIPPEVELIPNVTLNATWFNTTWNQSNLSTTSTPTALSLQAPSFPGVYNLSVEGNTSKALDILCFEQVRVFEPLRIQNLTLHNYTIYDQDHPIEFSANVSNATAVITNAKVELNLSYNAYECTNTSLVGQFNCTIRGNSLPLGNQSIELVTVDKYGIRGVHGFIVWIRDLNVSLSLSNTTVLPGQKVELRGAVSYAGEGKSVVRANLTYTRFSDCGEELKEVQCAVTDELGKYSCSTTPNCAGTHHIYVRATKQGSVLEETSPTLTLTVTQPICACPPCSEWSPCVDGKQNRTCYRCGAETNYQCVAYQEVRACLPALWFSAYPELVLVEQGKYYVTTVTVNNTLKEQQQVSLSVRGFEWVQIVPPSIVIPGQASAKFKLNFTPPLDALIQEYKAQLIAQSERANATASFTIRVLPSPQKQLELNQTLEQLEAKVEQLEAEARQWEHAGVNVSMLVAKLNNVKALLEQTKQLRDQGKYFEAYQTLAELQSLLKEVEKEAEQVRQTIGAQEFWERVKWIVIGIGVAGGAVLLAYLFWPVKPGYYPEKGRYVYKPS